MKLSRQILFTMVPILLGCQVTFGATTFSAGIEDSMRQVVKKELDLQKEEVVIQVISEQPEWLFGKEIHSIVVFPTPSSKFTGITRMKAHIAYGRDQVAETSITARVQIYGDVLVSLQGIRKKRHINQQNTTLKRMDITYSIGKKVLYRSFEDVKNFRASKYISKNRVLTGSSIQPIPIMEKDSMIIVMAIYKGITIQYVGISQEEGNKNDLIKVINPSTEKEFMAQIVDKHRVSVIL